MNKSALLLLGFAASSAAAQSVERQVVAAAGNAFSTASAIGEWTIGEVCVQTAGAGSFVLSQGFHQHQAAATSGRTQVSGNIRVYPNPAGSFITVENTLTSRGASRVSIYDQSGKLVQQTSWEPGPALRISTDHLAPGVYQLSIQENGESHSFKFIKI